MNKLEQVELLVTVAVVATATFYKSLLEFEGEITHDELINLAIRLKPHIVNSIMAAHTEDQPSQHYN